MYITTILQHQHTTGEWHGPVPRARFIPPPSRSSIFLSKTRYAKRLNLLCLPLSAVPDKEAVHPYLMGSSTLRKLVAIKPLWGFQKPKASYWNYWFVNGCDLKLNKRRKQNEEISSMRHEQGPCFNTFISLHKIIDIAERVGKKSPYLILNNLNRIFFKDCFSFICCSEYSYGIDMWLYISSHGRLSELIN